MIQRSKLLFAALSVVLTATFGIADDCPSNPPCIEEGAPVAVPFTRPPLISDNVPVGALWAGSNSMGKPTAHDEDYGSDDDMGKGQPVGNGDTATVDITNDDGDLSGPNGDDVTGGLDGECAEVYMTWHYRFPVEAEVCIEGKVGIPGSGIGGSGCIKVQIWQFGSLNSCVAEVCPCN